MHRRVIGWVIYGGRHFCKAKIFYLSKTGIEPRSLDLQANTLPHRCQSWRLPNALHKDMVGRLCSVNDFDKDIVRNKVEHMITRS